MFRITALALVAILAADQAAAIRMQSTTASQSAHDCASLNSGWCIQSLYEDDSAYASCINGQTAQYDDFDVKPVAGRKH